MNDVKDIRGGADSPRNWAFEPGWPNQFNRCFPGSKKNGRRGGDIDSLAGGAKKPARSCQFNPRQIIAGRTKILKVAR